MMQVFLAGCVFIRNNQILLLKRTKTGWFELPGGKIEPSESAKEAALREVKEELGVNAQIIQKLGCSSFVQDNRNMSYTWFEARFSVDELPVIKEPQTFEELTYLPLNELTSYHLSPNMLNFAHELKEGKIMLTKF